MVAMLVGSGAIVLLAIVAFAVFIIDAAGHVVGAIGVAIPCAAAVFAVAWFVTLRHATLGWNVAAGGVLAGVALMTVVVAPAIDAAGAAADARTVRLIRIDAQGNPGAAAWRQGRADHRGINGLHPPSDRRTPPPRGIWPQPRLDRLANAGAALCEPALVRDCGRFARTAPQIDEMDRAFLAKTQAFRTRLSGPSRTPGCATHCSRGWTIRSGRTART